MKRIRETIEGILVLLLVWFACACVYFLTVEMMVAIGAEGQIAKAFAAFFSFNAAILIVSVPFSVLFRIAVWLSKKR